MRYGHPGIAGAIERMIDEGCTRILAAPLYPQYCAATTATANDAVFGALARMRWQPALRTLPPYYDDPLYIEALRANLSRQLAALDFEPERLLLSFHGMPQRTLELGDPYHCHCQKTARLLGEALGREVDIAFQSRFGRAKWLEPATDATLAGYPNKGVKRIAIAAPGFSADCLETLEELGIRGRETFTHAGGEQFALLDCLNDSPEGMAHAGAPDRAANLKVGSQRPKRRSPREERSMARVAIVTGGTRGIGEAISIALKDKGMHVAANYAGNDERARAFTERTGIAAYKWDVADFDACQEGVAQGRGRARPGRRAGQQCRHHPRHDDEADGPRRSGRR